MRREFIHLSLLGQGNEPPSEFRVFTAGEVVSKKGTFLFDSAAADSVMSEYAQHGIDLMIDYDHASLSSLVVDPALSGKAAGWFNLELRNGELWAVNVRWTPAAAEALRQKEWRFVSPAFQTDESGRIQSVLNVAITNLPATRKLQPLMAASVTALGACMDPTMVKEALDALIAEDTDKCAELLKSLIAAAAGGAEPKTDEASEEAPADAPPVEEMAEAPVVADEGDKEEEVVATNALLRVTGAKSLAAAVAQLSIYRASHIELETERQKLAQERAVLEAAERREGCKKLVLAGMAPSRVWADSNCSAPKQYLESMPLADFREFLADAVVTEAKGAPKPPVTALKSGEREFNTSKGRVTLSASELSECERAGAKPEVFAEHKAIRASRAGSKGSV